jgi:hypothetical protein
MMGCGGASKPTRELDDWCERQGGLPGALKFSRLWGLATYVRNKMPGPAISDDELLSIVWETADYAAKKFDVEHPPTEGEPDRQTVEGRFTQFFKVQLVRNVNRYVDELRGDNGQPGDDRYQGPRGGTYDSAQDRGTRQEGSEVFDLAVGRLEEQERALFKLRHEEDDGWQDIAVRLGLGDRKKARSEYDRIIDKLRVILRAIMANEA